EPHGGLGGVAQEAIDGVARGLATSGCAHARASFGEQFGVQVKAARIGGAGGVGIGGGKHGSSTGTATRDGLGLATLGTSAPNFIALVHCWSGPSSVGAQS